MRILNVTQTYAPFLEYGGPPVKVRALSEALARRGHPVTVLTADWGLPLRLQQEAGHPKPERLPFGWRCEENGVAAVYLATWLHFRAHSWNPAVHRYCRESLRDFDVVHIFGLYDLLGPAVAAACRRCRIPYVVEPIGMFVPIVRNLQLKRMYHLLLGRTMLRNAGRIVATSERESADIAAGGFPEEQLFLRRNGVSVPEVLPERGTFRAAHGIAPQAKLVLFLGRLSSKKSPDLLLQAFAKLPDSLDGHILWLAFVGPDESGMRGRLGKMAQQLHISSRVQFLEPLFGEAKWAAYRDADVFVLPSQNENFGNTAAEAAAAGTPVIVTEECGIAPLLAGIAGLVVKHDAAAISKAIERLFTEPELHARLTKGCREITSRLSWDEPASSMAALYGDLVRAEKRIA